MKTMTITRRDIAWLWMSLTQAFGYKFIRNFGEKDNGVWFEALKDLTREDIEYGFRRAITVITEEERNKYEAWPPNVKEFRIYCEPRLCDFGLPSVGAAFTEVKNSQYMEHPIWTHPLVKQAKDCLQKSADDINDYANYKEIYLHLCQRYMRQQVGIVHHHHC